MKWKALIRQTVQSSRFFIFFSHISLMLPDCPWGMSKISKSEEMCKKMCFFWSYDHLEISHYSTFDSKILTWKTFSLKKYFFLWPNHVMHHLWSYHILISISHSVGVWVTFFEHLIFKTPRSHWWGLCNGIECFPLRHFRPLIHSRAGAVLHTDMIMIFSDDAEPWSLGFCW